MPKGIRNQKKYPVVQSNQFVRYFRHDSNWGLQQQRCYHFLVSLIKRDDEPEQIYNFKADHMREYLGMSESGTNYADIKRILKALRDNSQWIRNEKGNLEIVSILQTVQISEETGEIEIQFHRLIQPYLFNLRTRYTSESLGTLKAFDCKYTSELYLFLLSYFNENHKRKMEKTIPLKEIKERLSCEYSRWVDIKRFVIDKAMKEINDYSNNMRVSYEPISINKKVNSIKFYLEEPDDEDAALSIRLLEAKEKWKQKHKQGKPTKKTIEKREKAKELEERRKEIETRLSLNPSFEELQESNRELLEIIKEREIL